MNLIGNPRHLGSRAGMAGARGLIWESCRQLPRSFHMPVLPTDSPWPLGVEGRYGQGGVQGQVCIILPSTSPCPPQSLDYSRDFSLNRKQLLWIWPGK